MGLTIHYTLSTRKAYRFPAVEGIVEHLRRRAIALGFESVDEAFSVGPDYELAWHWPKVCKTRADLVPPTEGWLFQATPGKDCEPMQVGLCRYRDVRGWRLADFCKTQYASIHGRKHFLRCHRAVLSLLREAQAIDLHVNVEDEGGYWETGSERLLLESVGLYNRRVAGLVGALKDAAGETAAIRAPILDHPRFEHLEAEGRRDAEH